MPTANGQTTRSRNLGDDLSEMHLQQLSGNHVAIVLEFRTEA